MAGDKRVVLITGCSEGGLGAALARAFHSAGLQVYATTRDVTKMSGLAALGIETLELDILSPESIAAAVAKVPKLDILVNNAGVQFTMPISDIPIEQAKKTFDVNVWSQIAVTQAFLPLLLKSKNAVIANQTSAGAVTTFPFQATYNASKAAMAMFSDTLRLELEPFNIKVCDLRTGVIKTNMTRNQRAQKPPKLPEGSIYTPAKEQVEKAMGQEHFDSKGTDANVWAKQVAGDLLKSNPPAQIWRGDSAGGARIAKKLPAGSLDRTVKKMTGLDSMARLLKK